MTESPSNPTLDYRKYISQGWIRSRLQDFELLRRLRDDPFFRRIWIDNEEETRCRKDSNLDNAVFRDLLHAYLDAFEFKIRRNSTGRPTVHISPKTFRGKPYSRILGIPARHLSTALNVLVEDAVSDVMKGYGKGSVLTRIFGKEYGKLFNAYVIKRMQEEFGK
jgi:hypothetical protein